MTTQLETTHIESMELLCQEVLEPIRYHFENQLVINSGYRSIALCEAIAQMPIVNMQKGAKADIEIPC